MADAATFVLNLIDKVSGPAHDAASAVEKFEKQLKKTGRVGFQWKGDGPVPDVMRRLNRANLGMLAQSKIGRPLKEKADSAIAATTDSLIRLGKYGAVALGVAGTAAAAFAIKSTVHMGMFAESTRMAFGLLTGDQALGEKVFTRTIELSKQLGMDVEDTAHTMQKLLAMQMSPPDAEKWIKLGADLRSVGVDAGALQRVMLDIAHVKATGKLNSRNVNMFANAGVSAQLLMEEIGKSMGTDEKGAMEAMHKGKITSDIALPALERAIMRKTHSGTAGEAGAGFANKTLTGLLAQLQNAPKLFFLRIADQAKGALDKLKPFVDAIMRAIDQIQGGQFANFIGKALEIATKLVPLALEFATGFGEGFSSIVDAMGEIDPAKASMQTARDLGHAIADAFGLALKALQKIADMLIWLDQHRGVAMAAAGVLGIDRILGAGATAKGAWNLGKGAFSLGKMAVGALGFGGAATAAGAAGTAATTAATTGAAAATGAAGTAAATAGGTSGVAALVAGAGGATGIAAMGAAAAGIGAAAAGYIWREEIANWMLGIVGRDDQAQQRGLALQATPTAALTGVQKSLASPRTTNVELHTTVNVDGDGKDGQQLGKDIAQHHREGLEQFFQSQALEAGAM